MSTSHTATARATDRQDGENENAVTRLHAADLAHQDGRSEARDQDRSAALREKTDTETDTAQEVPSGAEELVSWDTSPDAAGHRMPESIAEDEADDSAMLAEEGIGEADQDLRRAVNAALHPRRPAPPA